MNTSYTFPIEISKEKKPVGFENNRKIARQGGTIAGNTRKAIEEKSGKKIVTRQNAKQLTQKNNNGLTSLI